MGTDPGPEDGAALVAGNATGPIDDGGRASVTDRVLCSVVRSPGVRGSSVPNSLRCRTVGRGRPQY